MAVCPECIRCTEHAWIGYRAFTVHMDSSVRVEIFLLWTSQGGIWQLSTNMTPHSTYPAASHTQTSGACQVSSSLWKPCPECPEGPTRNCTLCGASLVLKSFFPPKVRKACAVAQRITAFWDLFRLLLLTIQITASGCKYFSFCFCGTWLFASSSPRLHAFLSRTFAICSHSGVGGGREIFQKFRHIPLLPPLGLSFANCLVSGWG